MPRQGDSGTSCCGNRYIVENALRFEMGESRVIKILERYRAKNSSVPIIVEGRHDVESLRKIDFAGEIITVNAGTSLLTFSENISRAYKEVIILTDFDHKGHILKSSLERYLISSGCRADTDLWSSIRHMVPIRTVEELPFAVNRILETQN